MSIYLLVHGAWHGQWCWNKITPLLRQAGHQVVTFDLPGHGQDKTDISEVTLDLYVQRTCEILAVQEEPVILVGHSMGGLVLSQIANVAKTKIQKLVYLAGFLLLNGESLLQFSQNDKENLVAPNVVADEAGTSLFFPMEVIKDIFYADCSDEDITRAKTLIRPQAIKPVATPLHIPLENAIPRVYIETLQDRVISPAYQKQMYTASPCQTVLTLNTSHSPFFSAPETLSKLLLSV